MNENPNQYCDMKFLVAHQKNSISQQPFECLNQISETLTEFNTEQNRSNESYLFSTLLEHFAHFKNDISVPFYYDGFTNRIMVE